MSEPKAVVILSTAPSAEEAASLAQALVSEGLVACVNLVPGVRSIYLWEGKVQDEAEHLLVIKTTPARQAEALARLGALHSYDTPEAIALPVVGGAEPYLKWLTDVTQGAANS